MYKTICKNLALIAGLLFILAACGTSNQFEGDSQNLKSDSGNVDLSIGNGDEVLQGNENGALMGDLIRDGVMVCIDKIKIEGRMKDRDDSVADHEKKDRDHDKNHDEDCDEKEKAKHKSLASTRGNKIIATSAKHRSAASESDDDCDCEDDKRDEDDDCDDCDDKNKDDDCDDCDDEDDCDDKDSYEKDYGDKEIRIDENGVDLGSIQLPEGTYSEIKIELSSDCESGQSVQFHHDGGSYSSEESMTIKFEGRYEVEGNGAIELPLKEFLEDLLGENSKSPASTPRDNNSNQAM